MKNEPQTNSDLIFYQTEDGWTRLQVRLDGETVWLSLDQMADLFQRDKSAVSRHIKNVFDEGELDPAATVAKSATVQTESGKQGTRESSNPKARAGIRVTSSRPAVNKLPINHRCSVGIYRCMLEGQRPMGNCHE